ncbi:MAG: hypothetical protein LBI14_10355 [Treponema sp.]|jgi:hypothetical protein|nr:hypothetical protein [Treponema sp.]
MKAYKLAFFLFVILVASCSHGPRIAQQETIESGIIHKDYEYEKMFFDTHKFTFEFHLENTSNSNKTSGLIERLIYQNKNFDDYVSLRENEFVGDIYKDDYLPMIGEDGTVYLYHSDLIERYTIEYYDDSFVIIQYHYYLYYAGAAHGFYWFEYYIVDIAEERILGLSDLVNQIPDDVLKEIIKSNYEIDSFLRDEIWSPDSVNIQKDNITLLWNIYSITPYFYGLIEIDIQDEICEPYLTEKAKMIKKAMGRT